MKKYIPTPIRKRLAKAKKKLSNAKIQEPKHSKFPGNFSVDNPTRPLLESKSVIVEGWLLPKPDNEIKRARAIYNDQVAVVNHGIKRADVAAAFPANNNALYSGFSGEIIIEKNEGKLVIEVDTGHGYKELFAINLSYSPELTYSDFYNPKLSENMADHLNLLENKRKYFYEEPVDGNYVRGKDDPRLVAFYLPQFHPIKENDYVWGKNFTEWTNVTADVPRFTGHVQPYLPKDTGFYDLRLDESISTQIELAKKHGIYGFCFYYYWFSGKRLLEEPLDKFLGHNEWDFNFSICWANENWTKRWDGRDNEVIVAQEYLPEDPEKFIKDVEHILLDPRYIREDGKPVLTVFRASELKEPEKYAMVWREYFRKKHKLELHLVSIISFEDRDPREYGFDMALDFAPQSAFFKNKAFANGKYPYIDVSDKLIDKNFQGIVADYREVALNDKTYTFFGFPTYKCVTPSWDNDARKKGKGFVMYNESPDIYGKWLNAVVDIEVSKTKSPLVFVNAWNEWAEGTTLEPTQHYGRAILNRTTQILATYNHSQQKKFPLYGITRREEVELAVIVHLYYPEKWREVKQSLGNITVPYDLFVTLNEKDRGFEENILSYDQNAHISFVPNRGRDVLPFLHLASRLDSLGYKYFLKLHSKRSVHRSDGNDWFSEVMDSLLPGEKQVSEVIGKLKSEPGTLVGPKGHEVSLKRHMGSNDAHLKDLLTRIYGQVKAEQVVRQPGEFNYFGGTMFWIGADCLRPLLKLNLLPEDFEAEKGQIDGTIAHAIERLIGILPKLDNKQLYTSSKEGVTKARFVPEDEKYKFAP